MSALQVVKGLQCQKRLHKAQLHSETDSDGTESCTKRFFQSQQIPARRSVQWQKTVSLL